MNAQASSKVNADWSDDTVTIRLSKRAGEGLLTS
jgi:hypothetical protein